MQPKTLVAAGFLLAACQPTEGPPDTCGAEGYQWLVGQQLAAVTLPAKAEMRIIEPGMAVTMDYKADRMNVRLDETGAIMSVTCG